jgi:hypothetical protein
MAKTKYTNREALHLMVTFLSEHGCEDKDLIAKVDAMATAANKRAENAKKAPRAKSKETVENENRAMQAVELMRQHGEAVTGEWIAEHVPGLFSLSGANGCMRTAVRLGLVETCGTVKNVDGKQRTLYRVI